MSYYRTFREAVRTHFGAEITVKEERTGYYKDPATQALAAISVTRASTENGRLTNQRFEDDCLIVDLAQSNTLVERSLESQQPIAVFRGGEFAQEITRMRRQRSSDGWYKRVPVTEVKNQPGYEYVGDYCVESITDNPNGSTTVVHRLVKS